MAMSQCSEWHLAQTHAMKNQRRSIRGPVFGHSASSSSGFPILRQPTCRASIWSMTFTWMNWGHGWGKMIRFWECHSTSVRLGHPRNSLSNQVVYGSTTTQSVPTLRFLTFISVAHFQNRARNRCNLRGSHSGSSSGAFSRTQMTFFVLSFGGETNFAFDFVMIDSQ